MPFSSLTDYRKTLISIVIALRQLHHFSQELGINRSVKLLDDVLARIENDSFSVAVVGEFKRGKSTLINALLGKEVVPSNILPCSATINRITYGLERSVSIRFKNDNVQNIDIDRLASYVTKLTSQSKAVAESIKEATIYYPTHLCRNNVDIIDTPGLSDDPSLTAVTLSVLPQVDAAIMVIMATAPFSESERNFIEKDLLMSDLGRVIFVVTGIDYFKRPEDADKVVKNIEQRIKIQILERVEQQFGKNSDQYQVYLRKMGKLKVFGLSAYQALQAKQSGDLDLLNRSRFLEFEAALEKILTQERGAIALQVPIDRLIATATEIIKTIDTKNSALKIKQEQLKVDCQTTVAKLAAIKQARTVSMQQLDLAIESLNQKIQLLLLQIATELKTVAIGAIDLTPLTSNDFHKSNIDRQVVRDVEIACRKLAGKIQTEIQRELGKCNNTIQLDTPEIRQLLKNIGLEFVQLSSLLSNAVIAAKITEKAASIASRSGLSDWVNQNILGSDTTEKFKLNYKQAIIQEITKQVQFSQIANKVNDYMSTTFKTIKIDADRQTESLSDSTQALFASLSIKEVRNTTLMEREMQKLDEMQKQAKIILDDARQLSEQLIQILQ